jgi:hypothetical protein
VELYLRIIQRKAVSDEQQDSIQQIQYRFRSVGVVYQILINKSVKFSQSFMEDLESSALLYFQTLIKIVICSATNPNWSEFTFRISCHNASIGAYLYMLYVSH